MAKKQFNYRLPPSSPRSKNKFWWAGAVILALVLLILGLELTNTTHIFHKKTVPVVLPTTKPSSTDKAKQKTDSANNQSGAATTNQAPADTGSKLPSSSADSSLALIEPWGNFVSNHRPGEGGSSLSETSTCNTTPGAKCYIQLTNTSTNETTRLAEQTAGSDGSTSWSWDAGKLTGGEWQITAHATLNGQSKSATDPTKLVKS